MIGFDAGFERAVNPCPCCDSVRRGGLSRYDDRRRGLPRVDEARRLKHLTVDFDSYVGSEGLPVAFAALARIFADGRGGARLLIGHDSRLGRRLDVGGRGRDFRAWADRRRWSCDTLVPVVVAT